MPRHTSELGFGRQAAVNGTLRPMKLLGMLKSPTLVRMKMSVAKQVFDRESLLDLVDNDLELLTDMIEMLSEHTPPVICRLKSAVSARDAFQTREAAHELKGAAGNFFADGLTQTAGKIESLGRAGDLAEVPELLEQVERQFSELQLSLADWKSEFTS